LAAARQEEDEVCARWLAILLVLGTICRRRRV
jgi:hypothetical protein